MLVEIGTHLARLGKSWLHRGTIGRDRAPRMQSKQGESRPSLATSPSDTRYRLGAAHTRPNGRPPMECPEQTLQTQASFNAPDATEGVVKTSIKRWLAKMGSIIDPSWQPLGKVSEVWARSPPGRPQIDWPDSASQSSPVDKNL